MSEITISRRYAQALDEQAEAAGKSANVAADMSLISEGLAVSRELSGLFDSPVVSREKKADVFRALFSERLDSITLRFLELLVEKRREGLFPEIVKAYQERRDRQSGVVSVSARTALPLTGDDEKRLIGSLEKLTGSNVRLETKIDASILGGIVIRIGDTVYDASVVNQLASLRERLGTGSRN
ncbi:MAG: ATP synthase F1 subunit delta [Bacteroidetes bacterium]|nr:ATP synthase F1 subunit delta [Bacteroidota bacterium]